VTLSPSTLPRLDEDAWKALLTGYAHGLHGSMRLQVDPIYLTGYTAGVRDARPGSRGVPVLGDIVTPRRKSR
jgi:hypothetical protein